MHRMGALPLLLLPACGGERTDWRIEPCEGEDETTCRFETIDVGGVSRGYVLSPPPGYACGAEDRLWPVVFAWHGSGENGASFRSGPADFEGPWAGEALFVYPDGLEREDTNGFTGWNQAADGDDVAFFDALLAHVVTNACADPERVYSLGHSRGGRFVHTLACHRADAHAGFASVSAGRPDDWACEGPAPMLVAHGDDDQQVGYGAAKDLRRHWQDTNACDGFGAFHRFERNACTAYAGCDEPLVFCPYTDADWKGHAVAEFVPGEIQAFFSSR